MKSIIELAKQAGFYTDRGMIWVEGWEISPFMQRFAALVRAAALEEAEQKCDDLWEDDGTAYDCREAIRAMKEK